MSGGKVAICVSIFAVLAICAIVFGIFYKVFKNHKDIRKSIADIFNQIPKDVFSMPGFRDGLLGYSGIAGMGYPNGIKGTIITDRNPFASLRPYSLQQVTDSAFNGFGYTDATRHFVQYIPDLQHSLLCDFNNYTAKYLTELI